MKAAIRYIFGVVSLSLIGIIVFCGIYIQAYTKKDFYSKDYPIQNYTSMLVSKDKHYFYEYGYLSQIGFDTNRCTYIGKYDDKGNFLKSILIDNDLEARNLITEPTFLYESTDALYVVLSTTLQGNAESKSIVKLNKNDLSLISRKELDEQFEYVGVYDADESGFLFSNLYALTATDSVIKIIRTDFEGNVLSFGDVIEQIHLKYILRDITGSHEKIKTDVMLTNSVIKIYKDKIYICGTIANKGTPEYEYAGVVMCVDNYGNVLWRKDKTPIFMNDNPGFKYDETKYISRYNDIYIDDERIYAVGSNGKYGYNNDLPKNEQGAMTTPIIDEYELNGNFIGSNSFENNNKDSRFEKILKTKNGFLLLGRPLWNGGINGHSVHQKRKFNDLNLDIFVNKNTDMRTVIIDDKIIANITNYQTLSSTPKVFNSFQQFLNTKNFLSIFRFIQLLQMKIIVVLSIIAIICFFPLIKALLLKSTNQIE